MPSPVRLTGKVENGIPIWDSPAAKDRAIRALDGKRFQCEIGPIRKKRSLDENAYMWGVVIPMLAEACGYGTTAEDYEMVHEGLKEKFLRVNDGSSLPSVRSTASLNTVEFEKYMDQCRQFGDEMGVVIPLPNA